ncbi:methylated-DNA--[protein]-cysteine S-methyltransferase [Rummeliibacillus sp. TYF005]|nr:MULTISPECIES: methylated-DNA--[protein]-cysteine S-methyltransferase [unclassified Rummeliibacillus]RIJ64601.1 methylated-DNA--[protein]-cysteine S-methyltransferase [Rummeliibacillus sp. POC4]RPJ95161.1 methylated-DNA--[protein]-cysteine S-methyltransferase [Rummeliibacillus sp. TYF005]
MLEITYWTSFIQKEWTFFLVATEKGLCYVSTSKEAIEEWCKKHYKTFELIENREKMGKYQKQYEEYFTGKRTFFDIPINLQGTPFQKEVWEALLQIPFGKTTCYSEIANRVNRPKAVRAVGGAIGANPILIAIPCHRIIGKNGKLTGFSAGIPLKKALLQIENVPYKE